MIKHLLKKALLLQFFLLLSCILFAQQKTVTGKVTDADGKPVAGVTVSIKGSTVSTTTDANGSFSIVVPANETVLKFSSAGLSYQELVVGTKTTLSITMQKDTKQLDDVVVIGYGSQRARNVTSAMSTIDTKKIENMPVASLTEMLRGQVPGLNISGGATRPGIMATANIRQQFNWGKDNGNQIPLIVIDDIIQVDPQTGWSSMDRFNQLDLSEVESITVIKDGAAAIYGARGSQGAIIVKTKRGKIGAPRISYNAKFETNNAVSHGKVMNARQYGDFSNAFQRALGASPDYQYSPTELASMDSLNYDWLGNDWRGANVMQHSLDVSGGSDRATYFTGASFYTQGANLGTQNFKRWTYRAGTDVKVLSGLRFAATIAASNTNVAKSFTKINFSDGYAVGGEQNDYSVLLHMPKYIPWIYNIAGVDRYVSPVLGSNRLGSVSGNNSLSNYNYYALLNNGSLSTNKNFNYNVNFTLQYDVPYVSGLSFKFNYGLSQAATNTEADMFPQLLYQPTKITAIGKHLYSETAAADWTSTLNKSNTRVTYDNTTSKNDQMNFFITYDRKFGDHSISAMASVEKATNMLEDRYQIYDNPVSADIYNGTSVSAGTLNAGNTITYRYGGGSLSYLGRVNYSYKNRYLMQFVFRTDASTVFAPENYWGYFPAVSAGWIISDESFFKVPWINFLKVRANVGKTGNNNISAWKWLQLYTAATDKGFGFGGNGGLYVTGLTPGVTPNRNAEWDNDLQRNFGVDVSFLRNRLSVSIDQYINSHTNILTDMSTALLSPISVGGAFAEQNYSAAREWGTEISATWRDKIGKNFNYSIGINTSISNYKTTTYFDLPFAYPSTTTTRRQLGNTFLAPVWGFRTWKQTSGGDGMLRTDADIDNYWNYLTQNATNSGIAGAAPNFLGVTTKSGLKKGMLVYEDAAGDLNANTKTIAGPNGRIAASEDYVKLKKSNRTYGFATNLSFGWKGVSMIAQISTSWGGSNYLDYVKQATSSTSATWSQPIYLTDMYDSATNPNGKYPNLAYYDNFGGTNSDFFLLPTFRMVVRSLSIGYTLPTAWVKKARFESARFYVSGNNLWDLYNPYPKKYRNMYDDPKAAYPTMRTWAFGLSIGF